MTNNSFTEHKLNCSKFAAILEQIILIKASKSYLFTVRQCQQYSARAKNCMKGTYTMYNYSIKCDRISYSWNYAVSHSVH